VHSGWNLGLVLTEFVVLAGSPWVLEEPCFSLDFHIVLLCYAFSLFTVHFLCFAETVLDGLKNFERPASNSYWIS